MLLINKENKDMRKKKLIKLIPLVLAVTALTACGNAGTEDKSAGSKIRRLKVQLRQKTPQLRHT